MPSDLLMRELTDGWEAKALRGEFVSTGGDAGPLLRAVRDAVAGALAALAYPGREIFGMQLALEEAVVNAFRHGNRGDPAKAVRVCFWANRQGARAVVEDQGAGFDPAGVPDPTAPENLERSCGRGLFLMRHYVTRVSYNRRGNRVTLYQRRSAP
jgi:serine/threonine-protein kinase RsbW